MESKQLTSEKPMGQRRNQREIKNISKYMNIETQHTTSYRILMQNCSERNVESNVNVY